MEGLTNLREHTARTEIHMIKPLSRLLCAAGLVAFAGCASGPPSNSNVFLDSQRDPDAQPLHLKGSKVVAVVMLQDPKARRRAEDALAREITALGAEGVAMYTISPNDVTPKEGESQTRAAVESVGAKGVVVMRPVDVNHRTVATDTNASNDMYGGYWGGYYGIGWADPWVDKAPDARTDLAVTIETFVFSLPQNKLVWTGTTETVNPKDAESLIHKLTTEGVKELQRLGLIVP
jgi:hypothetical protein